MSLELDDEFDHHLLLSFSTLTSFTCESEKVKNDPFLIKKSKLKR